MGRGTWKGDPEFSGKMTLRRVYLDSGGYDPNGTYFGGGAPLYWYAAEPEDGEIIDGMLRATTRAKAKDEVRKMYPKARFWR